MVSCCSPETETCATWTRSGTFMQYSLAVSLKFPSGHQRNLRYFLSAGVTRTWLNMLSMSAIMASKPREDYLSDRVPLRAGHSMKYLDIEQCSRKLPVPCWVSSDETQDDVTDTMVQYHYVGTNQALQMRGPYPDNPASTCCTFGVTHDLFSVLL